MKISHIALSPSMLLFLLSFVCLPIHGQNETLSVAPIGRIHVDGALYFPNHHGFPHGAALSEIRAGAKATYGLWSARIEVGYSYGKIGMKDVYIQRSLNPGNFLRTGYFIPQFGIRGAGSASFKPAMMPMVSESFFRTMTRKIGLSFTHYDPKSFISATAFVGGRSLLFSSAEQGKVSGGGALRAAFHPYIENGEILQIGVSTSFESGSHTRLTSDGDYEVISDGYRQFSANFPTTVSKVGMLEAHVTDVNGDWKISPELIAGWGRCALESQFYYMSVNRKHHLPYYNACGAFAMLRCLLKGDSKYSYSAADGALALPSPKSFEIVAAYNYTDGNSNNSGIDGGIANDYSLTANYYINKYMIARLRYSYTDVKGGVIYPHRSINALQARLQFVF